jgi:hypothetical protein
LELMEHLELPGRLQLGCLSGGQGVLAHVLIRKTEPGWGIGGNRG